MSYGGSSGGSGRIATATDTALSNPANGDVLKYDAASQKWKNAAVSSSGYTPTATRDSQTGYYHADGYGVLPSNSATANTANFQALLDAIPTAMNGQNASVGGTVFIPEGRYHFSGNILVPRGVIIRGNGGKSNIEGYWNAVGTVLICDTAGMTLFTLTESTNGAGSVNQWGAQLHNLNFWGQSSSFNCRFIYAVNVNRWVLRDCSFTWAGGILPAVQAYWGGGNGDDCSWWEIQNCTWAQCATGARIDGSGVWLGGDFTDCAVGIDFGGISAPNRMFGTKFDVPDGGLGIRAHAYNSFFDGLYFEMVGSGTAIDVAQDSTISYSGDQNVFVGIGVYDHAGTAVGIKVNGSASNTKIIAAYGSIAANRLIVDNGTNTKIVG